jgi:E3 ubiquitin-protein ligase makorin
VLCSAQHCRFHLLGTCKFGSACTYSHAAGIGLGDKRPLCPYIEKPGGCRYGASCFLRHPQTDAEQAAATAALAEQQQEQQQQQQAAAAVVVEDVEIGLVVYGPNGEAHRQVPKQPAVRSKLSAHAPEFKFSSLSSTAPAATPTVAVAESAVATDESAAAAAAEPKAKAKAKADAEQCGICFDSIAACGKRFGLLTGCDHVFCLECIRTWRKSTSVDKDVSRSCPCCREHSYFVMPSKFSVTGELKVIIYYYLNLSNM